MQVFCINVPRASDRCAVVIEQTRWLSMELGIFPAIDLQNQNKAAFVLIANENRCHRGAPRQRVIVRR